MADKSNLILDLTKAYNDHRCEDYKESIKRVLDILENEDNTMEWVHKPHIYGVTYCSKCDYENKVDDTKFCPNCGRKAVSK